MIQAILHLSDLLGLLVLERKGAREDSEVD
jgi:hypothetical protein